MLTAAQRRLAARMLPAHELALSMATGPAAPAPPPPIPARTTAATLSRALGHPSRAFVETLELAALTASPYARAAQLVSDHWLFGLPLAWEQLPRTSAAVRGLEAIIRDAGAVPFLAGFNTADALFASGRSLGSLYPETYFGGHHPMFATLAHDMAALGLTDAPDWGAVDGHLSAVWLHELAHLDPARDALAPPYLDEAIAGYLNAKVAPDTVFPPPETTSPLVGWPTFSQVGQALCRAFGSRSVLAAHAGATAWVDTLGPDLLATVERLWLAEVVPSPNVVSHPDTSRPERWAKLLYLAAAGAPLRDLKHIRDVDRRPWPPLADDPASDREIIAHGLMSLTLESHQLPGGHWQVRRRDAPTPIDLDPIAGVMTSPLSPGSRYALPPQPSGAARAPATCVVAAGHGPDSPAFRAIVDHLVASSAR